MVKLVAMKRGNKNDRKVFLSKICFQIGNKIKFLVVVEKSGFAFGESVGASHVNWRKGRDLNPR